MAAVAIALLWGGSAWAQCDYSVANFSLAAEDGNNFDIYEGISIGYTGASTTPESLQVIIENTTTGWRDTATATADDSWFTQFGPLDKGQYSITLIPFCDGGPTSPLTDSEWVFNIICTTEAATPVIDDVVFTPICSGTTTVTISASPDCGADDNFEYYLDDPNFANVNNYDGTYTDVTPGTHTFTVVNVNNTHYVDTTINVSAGMTCDITATGNPTLSILDYTWEDPEFNGTSGQFFYRVEIPTLSETPVSVEVAFKLVGSESSQSLYYNPSTGSGYIPIPVTAKGDWEVKMRAVCCGTYPGSVPGEWFLIDTIHHYPNFSIYTEGTCYRFPPAQSENGSAEISFNPPHNVSSNSSKMGIRVSLVGNPDNVKIDTVGDYGIAGSTIEVSNLSDGEYKVYVYITDGLENYNNTYDAYLDTTFTVESRIKVTIQNDSSTFCATDSALYRVSASGGTPPYEYEWNAYETTFNIGDDSIWVNFDIASSYDPGVSVTDADGCNVAKEITVNLLPAYNGETDYYYDNYSYSTNTFVVPQNLCPLNRYGVTFDCSSDLTTDAHFQTADGCDSIRGITFTPGSTIGIPGNSTLDTTISGSSLWITDDGGGAGFYTLNSHGTAIIRAAGGDRDKILVAVYNSGFLGIEDTLSIYKGMDVTEVYRREGTWSQPEGNLKFMISGGIASIHFNTGSKGGYNDGGTWKGYRMEEVNIWTKSPDQLVVTSPTCGVGGGSVEITNPIAGVYYVLTNPTGGSDTLYEAFPAIFSNLTDAGDYTLRSYVNTVNGFESTNQDTTFNIPMTYACNVPSDGSTRLDIYDYDYHDQENGHNGPGNWQFYYIAKVPFPDSVLHGGVLSSVEFQYSNLEDGFTDYIYLDPVTYPDRDYVKIPIPYKGNWEVKVRARCCGEFPGETNGDWVLTDTIHHFVRNNLDFWNVIDYCNDEDDQAGYAEIYLIFPHKRNIDPSGTYSDVKLRVRLTNETTLEEIVDNPYDEDGSHMLTILEENTLPEGEYLFHPYVSNDEAEELCSMNLDTTFTIKRQVQLSVTGDSVTLCSDVTDHELSVTATSSSSGSTPTFTYWWNYVGDPNALSTTTTAVLDQPFNQAELTVTDNAGCTASYTSSIDWAPVYNEETEAQYPGYTFQRNRNIVTSQLPFSLQDYTFDGTDEFGNHQFTFTTAKGCDSIVSLEFSRVEGIALPSSGHIDSTISASTTVYDDGGNSAFAALHADRTLTLHAPADNTLVLDLTTVNLDFGPGEHLYVYDYDGVNDNMLLYEYHQGYNPMTSEMTSVSRSLTFRYITEDSCRSGFSIPVNVKDVSGECSPVYNVTHRIGQVSETSSMCNIYWEYSGSADSVIVEYMGIKWNDASGTFDTVYGPASHKAATSHGTSNAYCDNNLEAIGRVNIRAICGVDDTSVVTSFDWIPQPSLYIPTTGDTIVTLDSTIRDIRVYDAGGASGSYENDANGSLTLKAADGYELVISSGSPYNLESDWDYLYITDDYDGTAVNPYYTDTLTGQSTLGRNVTSRSGGFKFTLTSDGSNTESGVELYITQNKLYECLPSYNPKVQKRLADISTYYDITDAGAYNATAGDRVLMRKTNVATNDIVIDTMSLEMGDNSPILTIWPNYTMDVELAPLCGYSTTPTWSDAMRLSACQMPYDITLGTGTETNQQISWTGDASSYVVGYRVAYTDEWSYIDVTDGSTELTITGLFPSTTYEVTVASVCGDGDTSVFSDELFDFTFRTGCGYTPGLPDGNALTSIPDVLNFDLAESSLTYHYEMPDCWSRIETVVTDATDGTQKPYPHVTYTYIGHDQNQNRLEFYSNASDDQYAIMPPVILQDQASNWNIAFNASLEDTNCVYDGLYFLEFGVMTDPSDPTTFTTRKTVDLSTFNSDDVLYNFTDNDVVGGDKIYPAFKVAKRIGWNFHHAHILLNSVKFVPTYGLTAPTNVHVAPHPTQDNNVVVSWDAVELQTSDDQTSIKYEVAVSRNSNLDYMDDTVITTSYNTVTVPVLPGVMVGAKVSTMVLSSDYSAFSPWYSNPSETVQYLMPPYGRMAADTIGDITLEPTPENASDGIPIKYGEQASSVMLLLSSELQNVRNISAIAFRQAPDCGTSGFQNVEVYMKDVDITEFSTTGSGSYTIDNAADFTFTIDDKKWETMVAPDGAGWMIIEPRDGDSTIVHDPSKNLMIGIASWGGDDPDGSIRFVMDEDGYGKGLTMVGVDQVTGLDSRTFSSDPLAYRPQMMIFENKNCVGDTLIVDTNLCENATLEWRGQTIDLNASDAGLHFNSDLYRFIYYDTVPNAVNGGTCDSIYMLRVARKYNKKPDEADRVNNCGPYTWHGTTYYHSNGEMVEVEIMPGCSEMQWQGTEPITDTVRGVTSDGCDSIYTLNLTVQSYSTIIFDSTYADAGTGMSDQYVCTSSTTVPNCTMTRRYYDCAAWLYDGDTIWINDNLPITEDTIILQPLWEPACYNYTDSLMVVTDYEDFCMTNSSYTWHGHTVDFAYLRAHGYVLPTVWGDSYDTIYVDDTIVNAAGGVCDSIYRLRLTVGDRLMVTDYFSENADAVVCGAGYTWSDGRHYTADTGYFWWSDPDDSDHYSYANLNFNTAPYYIDSTTNAGCGTLHMLGIAVDDTVPGITVTFIKYYQEYATSLDTLYAMTASVCEDVPYIVPDMPDSVTREGYRFVHWTDNPACGWTVDPGEEKDLNSDYLIFYGVWESTCSDVTVADTMTLCPNDTVDWHGNTWIGQQYTAGEEYDEPIQHYDVIPGECDSIFLLHLKVPNELYVSTMPSGSSTYCMNQQAVQIELPISGGGSYTCEWYKDGVAVTDHNPNDASNKYTPSTATAGSYTLSAKVVAECGSDSVEVQIVTVYDILAVTSVSSDTAYCGGSYPEELRVEADGGSGMFTYQWYMNGEPLTNSNNFAYSPNTDMVGTFVYSVKVTDATCGGSDSIAVATITVQEDIQLTTFVDTTYCYGATAEAITLNTSGGTGDFSYTWIVANHDDMMPADTLATTTNVCVPITDSAAEYYYRVFITSGICYTERDVARIYVMEPVRINLTPDTSTICFGSEGTTYELTDHTDGGDGDYTYQWYRNGEELAGETGSNYMPVGTAAGTFVYSAVATDDAGCHSDTTTIAVLTVYDEITAPTASTDTAYYCYGSPIPQLTSGITGGSGRFYYYWYLDGEMLDEHGATLTPETEAGIYQYSVEIMDSAGCDGTTQTFQPIRIFEELRVIDNNFDRPGPGPLCINSEVDTIRPIVSGGSGSYTYQWYRDSVAVDGATEWFYKPTTDSAYYSMFYVKVTDLNGCEQVGDSPEEYINVVDSLRYTGHMDITTTLCLGSTVTEDNQVQVYKEGGFPDYSYRWYINGEPVADTATPNNFIMPSTDVAGTFSYSVKISAEYCGADSAHVVDITVKAPTTTYDTVAVCDSLRWINDSLYAIDTNNSSIYQGFTTDQIDTVADQYGCDSIVYLHLTVNPSGYLYQGRGGMAPDTMAYCYNSPMRTYSESQSPDYFTYQWYKDGELLTDATWWMDTTSLADTPGTHVYSLKVTSNSGCASDSAAIRVANIYEPFVVNAMQLDTAGCMEDTYLHLPFIDTNATGGSGNIFSNWYEIVGNDTIESNTVYMDSVGPGEYNFVMKETDTYGCGEGIAIYTTVTVAENYTASFVSNEDNTTTMSDISVCAIKGLVLPDNEFTYPNYNFVGWGTATTADTLQPGDTVVITGNTTYYTLWEFVCQNIDTTEIARICEGSTTTWHGYTVDGTVEAYVDTVTGVVNDLCDSIYHLLVEVGTPNEHDTTLTVCDSITWNGTLYTETPDTTLVYVLANGNMYGCDSTDKLTLTVIYSGHEYEVVTACDSYTMDNTIYTESADLPTITGEMPNGCPFYTHMSLTIHHSYYGDTSVTACVEYTWNDMTMRESGEQEFRGQTIEGCDSIVMLDLTINPATYGVDEQVVCDSLTWLDGNTYYDGFEADFNFITYTFEGANQYGCDSIVALGITMMEHIDVAFQSDYGDGWMDPTQTCENTPMVVPDCDYENPGYRFGGWLDVETGDTIQPGDTVTMENGRSYIAIWIPICNDAYVVTDTVMCTGDSLLWCGQLMAGDDLVSGSYEHVAYDVIENACDSIYMLRLTVYPTGHAEYYDTVHGEYMWNGEIYSTTGDYTVWVGRNRWGCDSLETLHLVVNLGIDDSDLDNMKLYPNPTRGDVNIEGVEVKKVEVLDMVGRTVATFEGSNHIDITDLPSGTYTLAITTMDDRLVTRRVAKR